MVATRRNPGFSNVRTQRIRVATQSPQEEQVQQQPAEQQQEQQVENVEQQVQNPVQRQTNFEQVATEGNATQGATEFYRQLYEFAQSNLVDFGQIQYNPEKILSVLQAAGVNIIAPQFLTNDASVTQAGASTTSHADFVYKNLQSVDKIIEYCKGIALDTISVDRLKVCELSDLTSSLANFSTAGLNPFSRPPFSSVTFGEFAVESVSSEAQNLKNRNHSRYYDFAVAYQVTSYVFDCAIEILKHMQLSCVSGQQCKSLAYVAWCLWQQVKEGQVRLVQIDQLASTDPVKRALAASTYKRKNTVLVLDEAAEQIESKASKLTAKQVMNRYSSNNNNNQYRSYGRYQNNFRGRGRQNFQQRPFFGYFNQQSGSAPFSNFNQRGRNYNRYQQPFHNSQQTNQRGLQDQTKNNQQ